MYQKQAIAKLEMGHEIGDTIGDKQRKTEKPDDRIS
jgi:hypothetical protein